MKWRVVSPWYNQSFSRRLERSSSSSKGPSSRVCCWVISFLFFFFLPGFFSFWRGLVNQPNARNLVRSCEILFLLSKVVALVPPVLSQQRGGGGGGGGVWSQPGTFWVVSLFLSNYTYHFWPQRCTATWRSNKMRMPRTTFHSHLLFERCSLLFFFFHSVCLATFFYFRRENKKVHIGVIRCVR